MSDEVEPKGDAEASKAPAAIVIGAGVAGMTAAHELAVRGFKVHVVEAAPEERVYDRTRPAPKRECGRCSPDPAAEATPAAETDWLLPAVGGLARSQYFWSPRTKPSPDSERFGAGFGNRIQLKVAVAYLMGNGEAPLARQSERMWAALDILIGGASYSPLPNRQGPTPGSDGAIRLCWRSDEARLYRQADTTAVDAMHDKPGEEDVQDVPHLLARVWPDWIAGPGRAASDGWGPRIRARIVASSAAAAKDMHVSLVGANLGRPARTETTRAHVRKWLEEQVELGDWADSATADRNPRFRREIPAWVPRDASAVLLMWIDNPTSDLMRERGPLVAPGEHGYRFFPSFYEHVFDIMRRTYVRERGAGPPSLHGGSPADTVYDNLISQPVAAFGFNARPDGSSPDLVQLDRAPGKTLSDGFRLLQTFQREIGFETRDLLRYQARMLEYATSCAARRTTYESMSWFDYIRADDGYSDAFVDALEHWPTALVGMRSREVDARTFGNAEVQILLDNVTQKDVSDATLNGPTSNAWFDPWRDYLMDEHDVTFHQDTAMALSLFDIPDGPPRVLPLFMSGLGYKRTRPHSATEDAVLCETAARWWCNSPPLAQKRAIRRELPTDAYVVLATSTVETYRLLHTLELDLPPECQEAWADEARDGTLRRMWDVLDGPEGERFTPMELRDAKLYGPLRHFVGAQLYDDETDLPFVRGHLFLPQHPWGLSAISQAQFGQSRRRRGWYPGVLSFDIGSMHRPAPSGPAVWRSTRENLLDELWDALLAAVPEERGRFRLSSNGPRPRAHIDDGLSYLATMIAAYEQKDLTGLPFRVPAWFKANAADFEGLSTESSRWRDHFLDPWFLPSDRDLTMLFSRFVDPASLPPRNREPGAEYPDPVVLGPAEFEKLLGKLTPGFNSTPYLIVPPGDFACWPGRLDASDPTRGYDIVFANLVLAGVHCRTFTRLATMESACESARHAVNGILRDVDEVRASHPTKATEGRVALDRRYERTGYCDIFPLEEREPSWTQFWKAIDARLFAAGLPHMFEILKVDQLLKAALPSGARRTGPSGEEILDGLSNLLTDGTPDPSKLSSWASPLVLQLVSTFLHARRS